MLDVGISSIDVRPLLDIISEHVTGRTVLDVGCAGNISEKGLWPRPMSWLHGYIARKSAYCVGIDIDIEELAFIKHHAPDLTLVGMSGDSFSFQRQFDVVLMNWVLAYLDPFQALRCAREALKPDGTLLLGVLNPYSAVALLRIWLRKLPYPDPAVMCLCEPVGAVNILNRLGFRVVSLSWAERRHYRCRERLLVMWSDWHRHFLMVVAKPKTAVD